MSKMISRLKSLSIINLVILSGCSTYSETFDCPPGSGVGCKSISEVDQMIDEGKLSDEKPTPDLPIELASYKVVTHTQEGASSLTITPQTATNSQSLVSRTPERHLRV